MNITQGSLNPERCRSLLSAGRVGRLVYTRHALPAVAAVHYRVSGSRVVIDADRVADWPALVDGAVVAFESDQSDEQDRIRWSVVVTGQPTRTIDGVELDLDRCVVTGSELAVAS